MDVELRDMEIDWWRKVLADRSLLIKQVFGDKRSPYDLEDAILVRKIPLVFFYKMCEWPEVAHDRQRVFQLISAITYASGTLGAQDKYCRFCHCYSKDQMRTADYWTSTALAGLLRYILDHMLPKHKRYWDSCYLARVSENDDKDPVKQMVKTWMAEIKGTYTPQFFQHANDEA